MKKIFLFTIVLLFTTNTFAQTPSWVWAKNAGGSSDDHTECLAVDASGNSYVIGYFLSSSITFGTTTLTNAATGNADIYIAKYDNNGNALWAKSAGGNSFDMGTSIAVDGIGNVYVTGYAYSPSISFDTDTLTGGAFTVKFDNSGNVIWAKSVGAQGYGIAVDLNGNVFVTGVFSGSSFIFGTSTLASTGSVDVIIMKYDMNGNPLWAKSATGSSGDFGRSVTTDSRGNAIITGYFKSPTITFGSTTLTCASVNNDMFIVKYDSVGNVMWARSGGATGEDFGFSVVTDVSDNSCYITGGYQWTATFGSATLTSAGS